ncbi:uncharacterized protein LOC131663124 isoform X2 [Phymastichus coffea]|nr:uncharacterized protein LOC131663124 isoform X2 [Phymastichus coffea]XP_058789220.1 uncharacterized protein LOC131663124 isoform X2 [Phymastichus coffea]XP_058789221.1 uncharacterized protein LOC131663124 isoform X2 [Phymastichus coffea]
MECMPLRPGPFHYLISEQAKSLVALQELQNEVGALLEFRDLVIETFPNLRHKMAVTASAHNNSTSPTTNGAASGHMSSGQGSHMPMPLSSQSPSSRRIGEWEPGKVRRRVAQSRDNNDSSSLPRSRSNSHSGGNKHSATVQDSGFSTETSSKDSASTAIPRPQSPSSRPVLDEAEDELWNLLDVIHRKGVRLREEVESLQGRLESVAPEDLEDVPSDILDAVRKVSRHSDDQEDDQRRHRHRHRRLDSPDEDLLLIDDEGCSQLAVLRREKLQLLDKVAELEAETISSRALAQELQSALKAGLDGRLRAGLEGEDGGILAPAVQRLQPIEPSVPTNLALQSPRGSGNALNIKSKDSAFVSVVSGDINNKAQKNRFRTRTIEKNVLACVAMSRSIEDVTSAVTASGDKLSTSSVDERRKRLGALDSVLISPKRLPLSMQRMRRSDVDAHKIAAILRERSPLELQRHLITTTVQNQALQKQLDEIQKSTETLSERLGKANEENEDLRFQLAERNIELEGTRARMRVLERLQQRPATENDADDESEPLRNGHHLQNGFDAGSSSAESSRDTLHTSHNTSSESPLKPSPRRRPSRIPLPGATKATAPKPPITSTPNNSNLQHRRNDSKDSLRSFKSNNNSSITSSRLCAVKAAARDSGRESLSKSTSGAIREPTSRSLPRNSSRDSLGKSSLSRTRDSLDSNGSQTPPRRPPAPARRSHSQAPRPEQSPAASTIHMQNDTAKSMQSSNPPSSWLSSGVSLYPDSLNSMNVPNEEDDEASSRTASTRVEFIIGSPTRKRIFKTPWSVPEYFDSIDTEGMTHEDLASEEYQYEGEALADCDSLECGDKLESNS